MEYIKVKDLSFGYSPDKLILKDINFSIERGKVYTLLGENGSGKTTILKLISGILPFNKGSIEADDISIAKNPVEFKRNCAFIPDWNILYPNLKVSEFIKLRAGLWGAKDYHDYVMSLCHSLKIDDKLDTMCSKLSQGMRQKVNLVAALAHNPKFLVMDEPFTGLDGYGVINVKKIMADYTAKGNSVLMTTHILPFAENVTDKIGFIHEGEVSLETTIENIKENNDFDSLESFIGQKFYNQ